MKKKVCFWLAIIYIVSSLVNGEIVTFASQIEYDIPQVSVNTVDGVGLTLVKSDGYVPASISINDLDKNIIGEGQIKVRGNSTAGLDKKPYTIKFDKKTNVLNMGKEKKWILLANYLDKSFMRNYLAFNLAKQLRLEYINDCYYVDLYLDGKYLGNYLLTEQVEESVNRVDINSANGDFLLEYESSRTDKEDFYIRSPRYNYRFVLHAPEDPTEEQLTKINNSLVEVEDAIETNDLTKISQVIDIDSFVDFYVFNEFIKTVDFGFSSTRFYNKDGLLYAGPAWDYDQAMGNAPTVYKDNREKSDGIWCQKIWYSKLLKNSQFKNLS